jgi:hypothetical protein
MVRGKSLAVVLISARSLAVASFWNILFPGGPWQARGWGSRKSLQVAPLKYFCCGKKLGGPVLRS